MKKLLKEAQKSVKKFNLGVETLLAMVIIAIVKAVKAAGRFIKKYWKGLIMLIMAVIIIFLIINPRKVVETETEYVYIEVPVSEDTTDEIEEEAIEVEATRNFFKKS